MNPSLTWWCHHHRQPQVLVHEVAEHLIGVMLVQNCAFSLTLLRDTQHCLSNIEDKLCSLSLDYQRVVYALGFHSHVWPGVLMIGQLFISDGG